jgi:predicted methyltransferase
VQRSYINLLVVIKWVITVKNAVLTKNDADRILKAQKLGQTQVLLSFDLGLTQEKAIIHQKEALVEIRGEKVELQKFKKCKEDTLYALVGGSLLSVDLFGEDTNLFYKLKPTKDWPTIMLSSVPMHRFRHVSPKEDTETKIDEIKPVVGTVLDTCCGLGYTSICSAREINSKKVIVFEKDKNVLEIAKYNPHSEELFTNKKIQIITEDVFIEIKNLKSESFDRIVHDPPTTSFAPLLYSTEFYKELFRVAKKGAIIYHYCPNPGKTKGTEFWPTIQKKLETVGFSEVKYHEKSSGIRALKK